MVNFQHCIYFLQDNINQFLRVCKSEFGLKGDQLFEAVDQEDPQKRQGSTRELEDQIAEDRRIRNVSIVFVELLSYMISSISK